MSQDQQTHYYAAGARPRRMTRQPAWMEEYVVSLPEQQVAFSPPDAAYLSPRQPPCRSLKGTPERPARMTPLASLPVEYADSDAKLGAVTNHWHVSDEADPLFQSTPITPRPKQDSGATPEVLNALHQLMEENQRMQRQMLQLQRRLDERASPVPQPHMVSLTYSQQIEQAASLLHPLQQHDGMDQIPPLPPPPPATAGDMPPPGGDGIWPKPPPPVTDDPLPPLGQDVITELTELLRDLKTKQQVPHPEPHPVPKPRTPDYCQPHVPAERESDFGIHQRELVYRGPKPTIPLFTKGDPREFARLKVALENLLPEDATERFKYQILVDHLKYEEALLIADSYTSSSYPYTETMASLIEHYGQPHQLALKRIADLMEAPSVARGDVSGFKRFALKVRALVGMLDQLGDSGQTELRCGSHVTRLLSKLSPDMRAEFKRFLYPMRITIPSLLHFSDWLNYELKIQETVYESLHREDKNSAGSKPERRRDSKGGKSISVLLAADQPESTPTAAKLPAGAQRANRTAYCPYCNNNQHFLDQCANFSQLTVDQRTAWIKTNRRCWRCGRLHQAAQCRLKMLCEKCKGRHLQALHEVNAKPQTENTACLVSTTNEILYLDRRSGCSQVLLKVSKVLLRNGPLAIETYAILDDGSERTIILPEATQRLKLRGEAEDLALRTVRQDLQVIHGAAVSFSLSPTDQPKRSFKINRAFTADQLGLAEHTHPVKALQRRHKHLRGLPLQALNRVRPLLLIGSDYTHLITPVEQVRLGPPGAPAAVKTQLGWTLQGPTKHIKQQSITQQCLQLSTLSPTAELLHSVERLWQLDVLPYKNERLVTRSRQDQDAVHLLETKTVRVNVDGIQRYATPLLRVKDMPQLKAPKEAVLASLRSTERRLRRDPDKAAAYCAEIDKLEKAGYAVKVPEEELEGAAESWFIPHHMVTHNGKNRIVFNCSYVYKGDNLNELLLPGPPLSASLLGVLLRFREHTVAVSSDIQGMFHQVRLLPEDKPLLRFLWRNLKTEKPPSMYVWQVLPFGTTCSPCCATFALQKHVFDHSQPGEDVRVSIERSFYVDNCLQSFCSVEEAQHLVDKLKALLAMGGFVLRQWASNMPAVISHLPKEARSESNELWLTESDTDPQELALGLRWLCSSDTMGYKYRILDHPTPTLRNIYRVLARLYDPLGFIVPFTTRAKVLVQRLWDKHRDWDDPSLPDDVLQPWLAWEEELQDLSQISLPRCYVSPGMDSPRCHRDLHIFADASEKAYGSVAYLRAESLDGYVEVAFLSARSRVAPKKQLSMPRLELCAALTAAQLASLLQRELTGPIRNIILWTDSTTVLTWLKSDSCRYKVFIGTRVAEIQELTDAQAWRYVDSANNPADDITRGKTLLELASDSRWRHGPAFLQQVTNLWPAQPAAVVGEAEDVAELRRPTVCCLTTSVTTSLGPDTDQCSSFGELTEAVARALHGAAADQACLSAEDYREAEREVLRRAQQDSFPEELDLLRAGKPVPATSRLRCLAPESDETVQLIRVGGRLRRSDQLDLDAIHPVVLDPRHRVSQLLIHDTDRSLHHPGAERLFAELRRKYWILQGREAVKRHQRSCPDCQRWRANPSVPRMADLPPARLRLMKPPFFSTGVDCFGPLTVQVGRRHEKRWGILFKCLTTRAVHLDVLSGLDTDSFLMALRRFIARRGKPAELLSDQGTNFRGGERELKDAFKAMHPTLQDHLAKYQIQFQFNPPNAPHFGGIWEREVRSVKAALYATIRPQPIPEEVLRTVLIEIEGILNSKPLGYVSTDVADVDPVTPNLLLMGRPDPSLPQAVYTDTEMLSRRRWRHTQVLADQFWTHFIRHYLSTLQPRSKWHKDTSQLKLGTIVMVVDPQLPRALWPLGRVTEVIPGTDGRVRTAVVQVKDKTYTRPVARLIALPDIPDMDPISPLSSDKFDSTNLGRL
ncbi:uncharacterized protein LOC115796997 [Archocentrus centrarchus]|uniref:uncharacterized protein LOC115796997 n=2 Tax=Archocentrus centrarchus TaxID=63155 RepID=UPI0011EA325A|nr:uncharacterized protein LOC115796997 [Archocentrus centrarchus]